MEEFLFFTIILSSMLAYVTNLLGQFLYEFISKIFTSIKKDFKEYFIILLVLILTLIFIFTFIFILDILTLQRYCEKQDVYNYSVAFIINNVLAKYIDAIKFMVMSFYDMYKVYVSILFGALLIRILIRSNIASFTISILYFIFFIILLPNVYFPHLEYGSSRYKNSTVKSNMLVIQRMIETYSKEWNGLYPNSVEDLKSDALKKGYWKNIKSPFPNNFKLVNVTKQIKEDYFKNDCTYFKKEIVLAQGDILYDPIFTNNKGIKYYLYGLGLLDYKLIIIKDKNEYFTLTNQ